MVASNRFIALYIGFILVIALITSACVQKSNEPTNEPTTVPAAPHVLFIRVGNASSFNYWGHNFKIEYFSANPQQVTIWMDGEIIRKIVKNVTDPPEGVYWKYNGFYFELKPVVRKKNPEGRVIPYYEETWNTSELCFVVRVINS